MGPTQSLVWKIYAGAVGAVTTIAAQKLITQIWKMAVGDEPPEPGDPDTPLHLALSWAVATGIGVGLVQLMTSRFTARQWQRSIGTAAPSFGKVSVKV